MLKNTSGDIYDRTTKQLSQQTKRGSSDCPPGSTNLQGVGQMDNKFFRLYFSEVNQGLRLSKKNEIVSFFENNYLRILGWAVGVYTAKAIIVQILLELKIRF